MEIQIHEVTTREQLKQLGSALTFEGLNTSEKSLNQLFDWLESRTAVKRRAVYVTTGATMNQLYGLTGTNAYPADLCIVSVDLNDLGKLDRIMLTRFEYGGRWLDDVIENNLRREREER